MAGLLDPRFGDGSALSSYTPTMRERATDWVRGLLYSDDREGQQQAERLMDVATFTPFGFGVDMYDAGREAGMGNFGAAAGTLAMAGMPGPSPKRIRAYHGSPHDFDAFSLDKIGTGEGAQAYGHGLYFADSEDIARHYRDALSSGSRGGDAPHFKALGNKPLQTVHPDIQHDIAEKGVAAIDARLAEITDILKNEKQNRRFFGDAQTDEMIKVFGAEADELNALKATGDTSINRGRMYEVEINADPDSFLDWDKPLSEQPETVKSALRSIDIADESVWPKLTANDAYEMLRVDSMGDDAFLQDQAYRLARRAEAGKGSSAKLREAGIPGIKYLDAGSRGAGDGTRNYVVFDDSLIDIIRKYGLAGLLGGGTATMQAMQDQPQEDYQ
jgi:hypothetical protein